MESLRLHVQWKGKIEVVATVPVANQDDLSLAYTPGTLAEKLVGADVFIGTSTKEMVASMNRDVIIFACANPTPEIFPEDARKVQNIVDLVGIVAAAGGDHL